ncbi:N-acetylmuramic acid 6-phosphate etherase [Georgenia subflava]|uniref:N-acetylmuramic acid 6-phosphate etherase n=1 Tax=Georgenia subflava TaxID=1622177 RepID=A0A6N7EK30_9MICO|nr:N-acetylmuramic acid 6-phosphate etherase [Georgenia subflava]MPV38712.1 N-acetylmuramic acid 6-phosphate etherase [Georgenia subflava]
MSRPDNDWRQVLGLRSPTEDRNPRTEAIDQLPAADLVRLIMTEDRSVAAAVELAAGAVADMVDRAVAAIVGGGRVHYVGSGTSGRLGVLDAVELLPTYDVGEETVRAHLAGGPSAMMVAVEGAEDDVDAGHELGGSVAAGDLVVGLTASGRTPFVAGALAGAREAGATTALVSTNPGAPLATDVDVAVLVDTGPEVITGSTRMKAATAQKLVLNTFSTAVMVRLGKTYSNLMIEVRPTNKKLRARTVRMLVQATGKSPETCAAVLEGADGDVRVALVALLSGAEVSTAALVADGFPPDPRRVSDPAGVRSAVAVMAEAQV